MTKIRMMLCTTAALICAACGDGTGPAPLLHRYDLVRVNESPLPVRIYLTTLPSTTPGGPEATCDYRLVSRRLELGRHDRYTITSSTLLVCDDGRPNVASADTSRGTYTLSGDDLAMTSDASLYGSSTWWGTRTGLELPLHQHLEGSGYGDFILDPNLYVFRAAL